MTDLIGPVKALGQRRPAPAPTTKNPRRSNRDQALSTKHGLQSPRNTQDRVRVPSGNQVPAVGTGPDGDLPLPAPLAGVLGHRPWSARTTVTKPPALCPWYGPGYGPATYPQPWPARRAAGGRSSGGRGTTAATSGAPARAGAREQHVTSGPGTLWAG